MAEEAFSWHESLIHTYEELAKQVFGIIPQLLGAVALLIAGWILARVMRVATRKLVVGLNSLFKRVATTDGARQEIIRRSYAIIASKAMFWIVMLFFITATGNMLGWKMFSVWMDGVISHLPNLVAGLLIILAGFLLGNGIRAAIIRPADSAGVEQSEILGRFIQILIILTAIIIGAGQIGINVRLLSNILIVIIGVLLAGGALAFGLGTKTLIANVIGSQYVRKHCRIGEEMTIGEIKGVITEVTQTSIILDTDNGRAVIPAKDFQEQVTTFSSDDEDSDVA